MIFTSLKKLVSSGIVSYVETQKNKKIYRVIHESDIIRLLVIYSFTFGDVDISKFVDRWTKIINKFEIATKEL